ncbi:MAG: ABC transporter substrate-binding protein [Xanthomonadales bacterium]|nr:ABC transporter substrate-binding protein [Xanthomonadales bacterium]
MSLAPAITETLFALDLGDRVIGRSDFGQTPPKVRDLPPVGTSLSPNFEAIARLRPAVIVTDQSGAAHRESLARLAEVIELPWLSVAEVADGIRQLGERFDRRDRARSLATRFEAVLSAEPPPDGIRVLFALDGPDANEVWYLRRNSVHGHALHAAGARNAIERDITGPAVLTPEELVRAKPDAIIVLAVDGETEAVRRRSRERFARLATLPAVRAGRIGAVVGSRFALPGPSSLDLVEALSREIELLTP